MDLSTAIINLTSSDPATRNSGINRLTPFVRHLAKRYAIRARIETDDALQIALATVAEAAPTFDRAYPAEPWLATVVYNAVITYGLRNVAKRRTPPGGRVLDFETVFGRHLASRNSKENYGNAVIDHHEPMPHEVAIEHESDHLLRATLAALRSMLTRVESICLVGVARGYTYAEIAAHRDLTVKQVDNARMRGLRKIYDLVERHGLDRHSPEVLQQIRGLLTQRRGLARRAVEMREEQLV